MLVKPGIPTEAPGMRDARAAAEASGAQLLAFPAARGRELEAAFAAMLRQHVDALLVSSDALLASRSAQIAILADRYAMPTLYAGSRGTQAGGLISYGVDQNEMHRQAGLYAGRISRARRPPTCPCGSRPDSS